MNRNIWKISLLVISLLVFQFGIPLPLGSEDGSSPTVAAISVPVNGMASVVVNESNPGDVFEVLITEPGVYRFNLSYFVDSSTPAGVDIDTDWSQTQDIWWPIVGTYFRTLDGFFSLDWNNRHENDTGFHETEVVCLRPGYASIDFYLTSYSSGDQVIGNLTVDQILVFAALPDAMPLGQNTTFEWTTDNTWQGFRLFLPLSNFYNFTAYGSLNWSTTAGWGGDASYHPLDGVMLIDLNYGTYMPYHSWNPVYNVPAGADENNSTWGPAIDQEVLVGGVYYLLAQSDEFELLNDSLTTFTLNVEPVPATPLIPGVPLPLQFNTTPNVTHAYVSVTIPEGYYFDAYFSNPYGINWTVSTYDAWNGGYTGPYYEIYEDPSVNYTLHDTLEHGYSTAQSMGYPSPGLLYNAYTEYWFAYGTYTTYTNGSITGAFPPGGPGIVSRFNTYYMYLQANAGSGPHSQTFNITANLNITPFPELTPAGLTFDFNSTVGPFYHCFTIPQASGAVYSVSALAAEYTTTGTVGVEDFTQFEGYRDWQYLSFFGPPLGYADPASGTGYSVNTNDTATLTYVSVRDVFNYLWVLGPGMVAGDMTKANVSLTITPPTPYALGTVATANLDPDEFTTYTFDVVAGNTYLLTMELKPGGDIAYGTFMNVIGESPFIIGSLFSSIIAAGTAFPFSMIYQGTFTARYTGRVALVVVGEGTVNIIIGFAQSPLSPLMIGALIGVAIVMLVIGLLIGYLIWKRQAFRRG
jgi:hypothetical protein